MVEFDRIIGIGGMGSLFSDMFLKRRDNRLLNLGGGDPGDRSKPGRSSFTVQARLGDIIAVAHAGLGGVGSDHAMTGVVKQKVPQEVVGFLPGQGLVGLMGRQFLLDCLEQGLVSDILGGLR